MLRGSNRREKPRASNDNKHMENKQVFALRRHALLGASPCVGSDPNKSCEFQRHDRKSHYCLWAHYCESQKLLSANALGEQLQQQLHWNEWWERSYIRMGVLFLHRLLGHNICRIAVVFKESCRIILQTWYGMKWDDWHMSVGCGTLCVFIFVKRVISPTDVPQHISWQDSLKGNLLVSWMETLI